MRQPCSWVEFPLTYLLFETRNSSRTRDRASNGTGPIHELWVFQSEERICFKRERTSVVQQPNAGIHHVGSFYSHLQHSQQRLHHAATVARC